MDLINLKQLQIEKQLSKTNITINEEIESLDEISKYDLVVTYYRHLGLDPYKLKGVVGQQLRKKIKDSPSFHAWLRANQYESVSVEAGNTLIETLKTLKKEKAKKVQVQFYGYPDKNDKNFKPSDTVKDETGTNLNYLSPN